jgi:hypothetical protein
MQYVTFVELLMCMVAGGAGMPGWYCYRGKAFSANSTKQFQQDKDGFVFQVRQLPFA